MLKLKTEMKEVLADTLKQAVKKSTEAHFLHRLHCVQLVAQGRSAYEVAKWFNNDASSIARWVRHFKESGANGLLDQQKSGRPKKLRPDQLYALKQDLRQPPKTFAYHDAGNWNGKLLALHLEEKYQLHLSVRHCQRLIQQLQQQPTLLHQE